MQDQTLPSLTHLQFLVLGILLSGERSGRDIRRAIEDYGVRSSAAAFYQMMARMERDELVEGWYGQIRAGDQAVTERRYRATENGGRVWEQSYAFYDGVRLRLADRRWSDA